MEKEFQVKKSNLGEHRIVTRDAVPLNEGEIRLKVDRFSFTANNMTYAAAGDFLGYWQFYNPDQNASDDWGIIPVWGMADVVESKNSAVPLGDRIFGYFPPATDAILQPSQVSETAFVDTTSHRQNLPPMYNRYARVLNESGYDKSHEVSRILLMPLYFTSFCLRDQLIENGFYGAEQIVIISASSKTALGLAHGLAQYDEAPNIVGLTSAHNVNFVNKIGYYNSVIPYASIGQIADKSTVVVDMAGNAHVQQKLHEILSDKLHYYVSVGLTHLDAVDMSAMGDRDPSRFDNFFVPSYALQRMQELGPAEFDRRVTAYIAAASRDTMQWMTVQERDGLGELAEVYPDFCSGAVSPTTGYVVKM